MSTKNLRITLRKSLIGSTERQRANIQALGLKKMNDSREIEAKPEIMGMVEKVKHLLEIESV